MSWLTDFVDTLGDEPTVPRTQAPVSGSRAPEFNPSEVTNAPQQLSWVDSFFGPAIVKLGAFFFPKRPVLEFVPGDGIDIDVVDDSVIKSAKITITNQGAFHPPTGTGYVTVTSGVLDPAASVPGTDHQAIVRKAGALTGVSPSTAGKLFMSDGTDWTADVPGTDHQAIVRKSGALTGVSPSTAGKVLLSDGTDWNAGAPGSDGDAIVRASGALAGVSPGASGNILTSNGSAWVSSAGSGLLLPGWVTAYDIDFTSLSLVTASGDGNFTIDGKTWQVKNSAKSSVMSVGGADGMRVKCSAATNSMSPTGATAPFFQSPSLDNFILPYVQDDCRFGIRVAIWIKSYTRSNSTDSSFFMISTNDANFSDQRVELEQYNSSGTQKDWFRFCLTNSTRGSGDIAATLAGHDCLEFELPYYGTDVTNLQTGVYSSGWPTKWYRRAALTATAATWLDTRLRIPADGYLGLGSQTNSAAGTFETKIGRMRIQVIKYYN